MTVYVCYEMDYDDVVQIVAFRDETEASLWCGSMDKRGFRDYHRVEVQ